MPDEALKNIDLDKLKKLAKELPARTKAFLQDPANRAYVEARLSEYDKMLARREAKSQQDPDH